MMNNEIKMVALNDDELECVVGGARYEGDGGWAWQFIKRNARKFADYIHTLF